MTKAAATYISRRSNTTTRKAKKASAGGIRRRSDRGIIPYEEMRRLMQTYGPVKCQRKRLSPNKGGPDAEEKVDSVKRKFYRWFPDLEARFARGADTGLWLPKAGHEFEIHYREMMRSNDAEDLAQKRARCRKARNGNNASSASTSAKRSRNTATTAKASKKTQASSRRVPAVIGLSVTPPPLPIFPDVTLSFDQNPAATSASITENTKEPVDRSFVAERGIFDVVESSFYPMPNINTMERRQSISHQVSNDGSDSWDSSDNSSIDEVLNKSVEECCDEILGSASSSSSSSDDDEFQFNMME